MSPRKAGDRKVGDRKAGVRKASPHEVGPHFVGPDSTAPDPFGLWNYVQVSAEPVSPGHAPSYSLPDEQENLVPTWSLSIRSSASGPPGQAELAERARQVQAIEDGLEQAEARANALLEQWAAAKSAGGQSFAAPEPLLPPEENLARALDSLGGSTAGVNYALPGLPGGIDLNALQQQATTLLNSLNHQLLHYAWVDTRLDGRRIALTVVNWDCHATTLWQTGLAPTQAAAHTASLKLAMQSRLANLRTLITVAKIAGKILIAATAAATPLGTAQAVALAWQFVQQVIQPLLKSYTEN